MVTARIFQLIDLNLLPAALSAEVKRGAAKTKRSGSEPLSEMVRLIMLAEPGNYSSMIGLTRAWFTRNIEAVEKIENAHQIIPEQTVLESLRTEVVTSCQAARLAAARALKDLNRQYVAGQTAPPADSQDRFWSLNAAFTTFYREMEEVELYIARAQVRASALQVRTALEAANLKLEAKRTALGRLQRQIARLRGETESHSEPRSSNTEVRQWRWGMMDGQRVAIYSETEMQANRLKEAQHRQYIEEIERIHQAFASNLSDEEIQDMMIMTKSMAAVGKRWRKESARNQKQQAAIEQGHSVVAETARLYLEAKRYTTRHIVDEVLKETGFEFDTDDVTDQLDILASEKRIAKRDIAFKHWRLDVGDFKIATAHMCLVARTKIRRKARQAKLGAKAANKPA